MIRQLGETRDKLNIEIKSSREEYDMLSTHYAQSSQELQEKHQFCIILEDDIKRVTEDLKRLTESIKEKINEIARLVRIEQEVNVCGCEGLLV